MGDSLGLIELVLVLSGAMGWGVLRTLVAPPRATGGQQNCFTWNQSCLEC